MDSSPFITLVFATFATAAFKRRKPGGTQSTSITTTMESPSAGEGHAHHNMKLGSRGARFFAAVPDSMCPHRDSSVAPAFKATVDWCEGHALRASRKGKLGLKVERPPKTEGRCS